MLAPTYVSVKSVFSTFGPRADHKTAPNNRMAAATNPITPSNPMPARVFPMWISAGIGGQPRRIVVGLHQPEFSSGKICQDFGVLSAHVACPDYFGTIDVSVIENPFVQNHVVARLITDQNE